MLRVVLVFVTLFLGGVSHVLGKAVTPSQVTVTPAQVDTIVSNIETMVADSQLLKHDFLTCYAQGGYYDMAVATKLFIQNHYAYSRNFQKYLQAVVDKLEKVSPEDTHLLLENLEEERGHYSEEQIAALTGTKERLRRESVENIPHPLVLKRFLDKIGVTEDDLKDPNSIGGVFTRDIIRMYDESNACEALAIIGFAIERTVPRLYQYIWDGLKLQTDLEAHDYVFFPLHILVDDGHADHIITAFKNLYVRRPDLCSSAPEVVKKVMDRRVQMLSDLKADVEAKTGGSKCGTTASGQAVTPAQVDTIVSNIETMVADSQLLKHDFLTCYGQGGYYDMAVATKLFIQNHYAYSRNFQKYLQAVVDKLEKVSPEDTHLLLEDMEEERGRYSEEQIAALTGTKERLRRESVENIPHPLVLKRFLDKIGVTEDDLKDPNSIGGVFTRDIIRMYDESNACEALAIIGFAIERTVPRLYQYIWDGLKLQTDLEAHDYVFFPLHILVDDGHADHIITAFKNLYVRRPDLCSSAPEVVKKVMDRRVQMLSDLKADVEAKTGGSKCGTTASGQAVTPAQVDTIVSNIETMVADSQLLKHDFLTCYAQGGYYDMAVATKLFIQNHYAYSRNFQKYLQAVVDKLEKVSPEDTHLLLENMEEERGHYSEEQIAALTGTKERLRRESVENIPHPLVLKRFLDKIGVTEDDLKDPNSIGGVFTRDIIRMYDESNACEALAIIGFAIERTVPRLYQYIWDGLKLQTDLEAHDYVFFPLHILVDDGHADHIITAFKNLYVRRPDLCSSAPEVVKKVMDRRVQMLSDLKADVEAKTGGSKCGTTTSLTFDNAHLSSSMQDAVKNAVKIASNLAYPQYSKLQNMAIASRILADQGHGGTLSGQISCRDVDRDGNLAMWTAQYGRSFEEMTPANFIKINAKAETIEGEGGPNMAVRFHLHVYNYRPDVQCIVHSHPLHASTLAQMGVPLRIAHMDVMAFYDDVQYLDYWPGIPFGNEEGELIEKHLGSHNSILLAHHGLLVTGKSLEEAVYRAYFFEKASQMQLLAMAANGGKIDSLPVTEKAVSEYARNWRISEGPVKAHYYSWARQTIEKNKLSFV